MAVHSVYGGPVSASQQAPGGAAPAATPSAREASGASESSPTAGGVGSKSGGQYVGNVSDHRGKYYSGSGAVGNAPPGEGCLESMAANGAVAWDKVAGRCWGVTGLRIIIGDRFESIMAGFEKVNFNFHVSGTQPAVPNQWSLPGPVSMGV